MDQTPNLKLPYIMPSQAQKHVTHNEAIRLLEAGWVLMNSGGAPSDALLILFHRVIAAFGS